MKIPTSTSFTTFISDIDWTKLFEFAGKIPGPEAMLPSAEMVCGFEWRDCVPDYDTLIFVVYERKLDPKTVKRVAKDRMNALAAQGFPDDFDVEEFNESVKTELLAKTTPTRREALVVQEVQAWAPGEDHIWHVTVLGSKSIAKLLQEYVWDLAMKARQDGVEHLIPTGDDGRVAKDRVLQIREEAHRDLSAQGKTIARPLDTLWYQSAGSMVVDLLGDHMVITGPIKFGGDLVIGTVKGKHDGEAAVVGVQRLSEQGSDERVVPVSCWLDDGKGNAYQMTENGPAAVKLNAKLYGWKQLDQDEQLAMLVNVIDYAHDIYEDLLVPRPGQNSGM